MNLAAWLCTKAVVSIVSWPNFNPQHKKVRSVDEVYIIGNELSVNTLIINTCYL